jgi:hypothetical protein
MKTLLIGSLTLLTVLSINANAACDLTMKSKTEKSAGAQIGDVKFSKKQLEALQSLGCKISRNTFSNDELIKLEELSFQKRIAKLKTTKTAKN